MCTITHWYLKRISTYLASNVMRILKSLPKLTHDLLINMSMFILAQNKNQIPKKLKHMRFFQSNGRKQNFKIFQLQHGTCLKIYVYKIMYVINFHWRICGSKRQWIVCTNLMYKRLIITTKLSSPCIKFCATYFIFILKFVIIIFLYGMFCSWEYGSKN